jgi:hypothetical protein
MTSVSWSLTSELVVHLAVLGAPPLRKRRRRGYLTGQDVGSAEINGKRRKVTNE